MAYALGNPLQLLCSRLNQRHRLEPESELALCELDFELRRLASASFLLKVGEPVRSCSILLSGIAYRSKTIGNGERQIVSVHVPGDILDLQNLLITVVDHDVQMLTDTTIAIFPKEQLIETAFRFPSLGRALWRESLFEEAIYREWLTNVGRRDSLTRVAHFLCEFCLRLENTEFGFDHGYALPMSQEQMGDCLGLTGVHVNRMLRRLETMHLIDRTRRAVVVVDWHGLSQVGDFSPDYLHVPLAEVA